MGNGRFVDLRQFDELEKQQKELSTSYAINLRISWLLLKIKRLYMSLIKVPWRWEISLRLISELSHIKQKSWKLYFNVFSRQIFFSVRPSSLVKGNLLYLAQRFLSVDLFRFTLKIIMPYLWSEIYGNRQTIKANEST